MTFLIDTHIFLWALHEPHKLTKNQRKLLEDSKNKIFVSAISIAELTIKSALGKLDIPYNPLEMLHEIGFLELDFTAADALLLQELPFHHRDPFDRMLIVQAINRQIALMSSDRYFHAYAENGLEVAR